MPNYYPGAPRAIEPVQSGRLPFFPWGYKRTEQDQSAWESMNQLGKQLIDKGMLGELDHKVFDLKIDPDMQRIADENSKAMTKIQREIIEHEYRKAAVAAYEDRRSMRCQNEATWMGKPLKDVVISGWEHKNQGYELTIQGEMDDYGKCNMFYVQVRKNDLVMRVVIKINPWGVQCDTTFNESTLDEIVIAADMARRNIDREMARRTPDSIYMNLGPYGERDGEYAAREPRGIYSEPRSHFLTPRPKHPSYLFGFEKPLTSLLGIAIRLGA